MSDRRTATGANSFGDVIGNMYEVTSNAKVLILIRSLSVHIHRTSFSHEIRAFHQYLNMASKKLLVIFGATGSQGGSVVKSILGDPKTAAQFAVRAVTRDPSKPRAQDLAAKGAEIVTVRSRLLIHPTISLSLPTSTHEISLDGI